MDKEAKTVWIFSKQANLKKLFTPRNNKISVSYLQAIFPKASTIEYNDTVLEPENGFVTLVEGVDEYQAVYPANILAARPDGCSFIKTDHQRQQLHKALKKLTGTEDASFDSVEPGVDEPVVMPQKKHRKTVHRNIHVGWKHQYASVENFKLMTGVIGGSKSFLLQKPGIFSYDDIQIKAIDVMKSSQNRIYFEQAKNIFIGSFTKMYSSFTNENVEDTDFWNFSDNFKATNHTIKVYIYTSDRDTVTGVEKGGQQAQYNSPVDVFPSVNVANYRKIEPLKVISCKESNSQSCNQVYKSNSKPVSFSSPLLSKASPDFKAVDESQKKLASPTSASPTSYSLAEETDEMQVSSKNNNFKIPQIPIVKNNVDNVIEKVDITLSSEGSDDDLFDGLAALKKLQLSVPIVEGKEMRCLDKLVGRGGQGVVKKARWNGTDVAIKKIKIKSNNKYVLREIQCMHKIRHPNIISIMAVAADDFEFSIIMEYFPGINLRQLMKSEDTKKLYGLDNDAKKGTILKQICSTVHFLHCFKPQIIHKDLKPDNILIDKSLNIKICDLGLSRYESMCEDFNTTVGQNFHGTIGYMAPEIMLDNLKGGTASDVWSLACVIVELYNGELWATNGLQMGGNKSSQIEEMMKKKETPHYDLVPIKLIPILEKCFSYDPEERPSANKLVSQLCIIYPEE